MPYAAFADCELSISNVDVHFASVNKEDHLHSARVFGALETPRWNLYDACAEERETL
jgi:hypothetical protein